MLALAGYATRYHKIVKDNGEHVMLLPTAFDRTLRTGTTVKLLLNHFDHQCVGSTADRSLELCGDQYGLAFRYRIPETKDGRYIRWMAESKNHTCMSILFDWRGATKVNRRIGDLDVACIVDADLIEISYMHGYRTGLMKDAYATLQDLDYSKSLLDNCSGGRFVCEGAAVGVTRALQDIINNAG